MLPVHGNYNLHTFVTSVSCNKYLAEYFFDRSPWPFASTHASSFTVHMEPKMACSHRLDQQLPCISYLFQKPCHALLLFLRHVSHGQRT